MGIEQETYFFDWVISSRRALETSLMNFNALRFLNEGYRIVDGGRLLEDHYSGLRFRHELPISADGTIDEAKISHDVLVDLKKKYLRRRLRLFNRVARNGDQVVFLQYLKTFPSDLEINATFELLKTVFGADQKIAFLTSSEAPNRCLGSSVNEYSATSKIIVLPITTRDGEPWRATTSSANKLKLVLTDLAQND